MKLEFPKDFLWGSATASYQVEGAVNQDGKGMTSWDKYYHMPNRKYNGDVSTDHYNRYKEDIKLLSEINQKTYRFSVSWARIFPNGSGEINEKGLQFYDNLVDELLANNIEPNLTLYHWDMPLALMDKGGWLNREVVDNFVEYSKVLFTHFRGRVKLWSTINEPASEVMGGYIQGAHPPLRKNYTEALQVAHHLNLAHAKAVKLFNEMNMEGEIGIVLNPMPIHPASDKEEDIIAAKRAYDFYSDWYIAPILAGKYPERMLEECQKKYNSPKIEPGDMEILKGAKVDYLGVNYYMRRVVANNPDSTGNIDDCFKNVRVKDGNYTEWGWEIYPEGLYELLSRIQKDYGKIDFYITENGMGFYDKVESNGQVIDDDRLDYIRQHIIQIHRCLEDGINIKGYYVWSAIDLLSWTNGFEKRYGLIRVDFDTLERSIKKSGRWYADFIANNYIEYNE